MYIECQLSEAGRDHIWEVYNTRVERQREGFKAVKLFIQRNPDAVVLENRGEIFALDSNGNKISLPASLGEAPPGVKFSLSAVFYLIACELTGCAPGLRTGDAIWADWELFYRQYGMIVRRKGKSAGNMVVCPQLHSKVFRSTNTIPAMLEWLAAVRPRIGLFGEAPIQPADVAKIFRKAGRQYRLKIKEDMKSERRLQREKYWNARPDSLLKRIFGTEETDAKIYAQILGQVAVAACIIATFLAGLHFLQEGQFWQVLLAPLAGIWTGILAPAILLAFCWSAAKIIRFIEKCSDRNDSRKAEKFYKQSAIFGG